MHEWQDGSRDAFEQLVPLVYSELHMLASRRLARVWRHDRMQTTAVVNEAYMKREWAIAKGWLFRELSGGADDSAES